MMYQIQFNEFNQMLLYKYDEEIIKEVDTSFDISLQIILYTYIMG